MTAADHKPDELVALKSRLTAGYLGQHGIHGFGIRRRQNQICMYVDRESDLQPLLLEEIRSLIAPYDLVVVEQVPPRLMDE